MSDREGTAARHPCTCGERDHLETNLDGTRALLHRIDASAERYVDERNAALAMVAALREAAGNVLECWPWIVGDRAGLHLAAVRSDTAAAATEYERRVRAEALAQARLIVRDVLSPLPRGPGPNFSYQSRKDDFVRIAGEEIDAALCRAIAALTPPAPAAE